MNMMMKSIGSAASLLLVGGAYARNESPQGATALCNDGAYTHVVLKTGACSHHGGIRAWYGLGGPPAATQAQTAPMPTPDASIPPAVVPAPSRTSASLPTSTATPGAPGVVWVNPRSKVYHCSNDPWYGKTMRGAYMKETDARTQGYRADRGKACM